LIYVHLCGVVGGVVGSLVGFTSYDLAGALPVGLIGVVVCELAARALLQPRRPPRAATTPATKTAP
jgi:hypothetical protein